MSHRFTLLTAILFIAGAVGVTYWNASNKHHTSPKNPISVPAPHHPLTINDTSLRPPTHHKTTETSSFLLDSLPPQALPNERILTFENEESYRAFLQELSARNLKLLGSSDRLLALRVGLTSSSDLSNLKGATESYNYSVIIPKPPQVSAQASATGFGGNMLSWLGVHEDNTSWGAGVTVAVIDSGVNDHVALQGNVTRMTLTDLSDGAKQLSHGTAVASIISGDHPLAQGIAPASDILSIRVTDETGQSNSFTLAEGIIAAADAGASVINVSMGSYADSSVVANAVDYAQKQGSVIVASAGNEGLENLAYPAAYEGVISVGAVEQGGDHLDFSNAGENLTLSAPGYEINAAWGSDLLTSFSGTSASAPVISGAIAATLSENPNMSPKEAADLVTSLSNDAGYPGEDSEYGSGILDLGRVMNHGTPGIYDAAVTGQVLVMPTSPTSIPEIWITVQNQGTETLINSPVSIQSPSGVQNLNISSLTPGAIQTFRIPVTLPNQGESIAVTTSVQSLANDSDPANNTRTDQFIAE
jgi:hypothetical protein